MRVQVTANVGPGQRMRIKFNEKLYDVVVPAGISAGQAFQVDLPSENMNIPVAPEVGASVNHAASQRLEEEARKIFNEFDVNKDGYIDRVELFEVLRRLGVHTTRDASEVLRTSDYNGDGRLDFTEFVQCYNSLRVKPPPTNTAQNGGDNAAAALIAQQQAIIQQQQQQIAQMQVSQQAPQQYVIMQQQQPVVVHSHQPYMGGMGFGTALVGGMVLGSMFDGGGRWRDDGMWGDHGWDDCGWD